MTKVETTPPARTRDAARTKDAILRAAQTLFGERGYTTTGVREVAAEAGVNSTLVRRYFGSKEGLLRAAMEDVLTVEPFITGDRKGFGARAVALLLIGETFPSPLAMMLLATADPAARLLCRELMHERIIVPLADWLGGEGALARSARLNTLWIGFMASRQIFAMQPLFGPDEASTLGWLEGMSQSIADENGA